jgi:type IV pilus assembly protein PilA
MIRRTDDERGFTLIELMVVVLIIGLLIAIALPTYLGARSRAVNKATMSDLRTALAASKVHFTDGATYTGFDVPTAQSIEPHLAWVGDVSPAVQSIAIAEANGDDVDLVSQTSTGLYLCLSEISAIGGGVHYGMGATFSDVDTSAECFVASPP